MYKIYILKNQLQVTHTSILIIGIDNFTINTTFTSFTTDIAIFETLTVFVDIQTLTEFIKFYNIESVTTTTKFTGFCDSTTPINIIIVETLPPKVIPSYIAISVTIPITSTYTCMITDSINCFFC